MKVVDSRSGPDGLSVRRRRKCVLCGKRITTIESVKLSLPQVIKSDGRKQDFDEGKLVKSIKAALGKDSLGPDALGNLKERILLDVFRTDKRQMHSLELGRIVIEELKDDSPMASIRYASMKAEYRDLDSLGDELARLQKEAAEKEDEDQIEIEF